MTAKKTINSPSIFAISDFHLPGGDDKPMEVFGSHWEGHFEQICKDWREKVAPYDTVLIPGDTSWAMTLDNAMPDLLSIGALPGKKILLKGNHDYWWSSITKLRERLPDGMYALQNDALALDDNVFCGARGWVSDGDEQDLKIYRRELIRLEMSLAQAQRLRNDRRLIALLHYPPVDMGGKETEVTALLERFNVNDVVYGHIHGQGTKTAFSGLLNGVRYHFVSCDGLGFRLLKLPSP